MSPGFASVGRWFQIDRALTMAVAARVFQLIAAPITLLVIGRFFSPELQGFHYTFMSLIALQSFAELGFSVVIVNTASHQWATLSLSGDGRIVGDADALSRLVSLGRLTFRWYAWVGVLFVVFVTVIGLAFFAGAAEPGITWRGPWVAIVALAGLQLWMLAFTAILEGCNQIAEVYRFRLAQAVLCNTAFWVVAAGGGGLWAGVALAAVRLAVDGTLVAVRYRSFFRSFRQQPAGPQLVWRDDLWPMQWRLALSGFTHYFAMSLFTPVLFKYHGPVIAGQLGMSWQAIGGIQSVAGVWLTTRVPALGALVATRSRVAFHELWRKTSAVSLLIFTAGASMVLVLLWVAQTRDVALTDRLLPAGLVAVLVAAVFLMQVSQCQTAYMRAHRVEPIVVLSVVTNLLFGAAVWLGGRSYSARGMAWGVLAVATVLVVWESFVWYRFKSIADRAV